VSEKQWEEKRTSFRNFETERISRPYVRLKVFSKHISSKCQKSFLRHRPLFEKELTTGMRHILKAGERPKHQRKTNLGPHPATSAKNKKKEAIKNENVVFNYIRLMIM